MKNLKILIPIFVCILTSCTYTHIGSSSEIKYDESEKYRDWDLKYSSGDIDNIKINWISGNINIVSGEGNEYSFSATDVSTNPYPEKLVLRTYINDKTINIETGYPGKYDFNNFRKDLNIVLPTRIYESITINAIAGELNYTDLEVKTVKNSTVSASSKVVNSKIKTLKHFTISGDLNAEGEFANIEIDSTSSNAKCKNNLDSSVFMMNTVSGNADYTYKNGAGFKATFSTVSGKFSSNESIIKKDDTYSTESFTHMITFNSVSGSLKVTKE